MQHEITEKHNVFEENGEVMCAGWARTPVFEYNSEQSKTSGKHSERDCYFISNTEVTLYTYLNVREDAVDLFGFATKAELETFKNLISVSGVGPKAGLAVLSELSPEQVAMAIASDDLKTITRAQGIGKKIAQRIVLELKDKLAKAAKEDSSFAQAAQNSVNVSTGNVPKAIEALGVLGYSPSDVSPVLATLDSALPVEQLISLTLKQMGRQ